MLWQFKIGHFTDLKRGTGCTVILPPKKNVASASVQGAAPGTRELALLSPQKKINSINALILTGGSAFGLGCVQGVMEALAAKNIGYETNYGVVPIIPAAVIFDRNVGQPNAYPSAKDALKALQSAKYNNYKMGNIGAGTGASVGKWRGMEFAMKSGIGLAEAEYKGLKVAVLTVVNAVGDILNKKGQFIAGAIDHEGHFLADENYLTRFDNAPIGMAENTVLGAVFTNARINKQQAFYLAERAHYGIARRVEPSHTGYDGDVCFVLASPKIETDIDLLASMVVPVVEESILNGVRKAETLYNLKASRDLKL